MNAEICMTEAKNGSAQAQYNLATMYRLGHQLPQNQDLAFKWYRRAAKQGLSDAFCSLGVMSFLLESDDKSKAIKYWNKAAAMGNALAMGKLGLLYQEGRYVPKDLQKSHILFKKAAKQGDAGAQFFLGMMYARKQLFKKAAKLLSFSAEQNLNQESATDCANCRYQMNVHVQTPTHEQEQINE
ncbi:MAG: sel1 repeat family protein [Magnetococcus sp. YQC-5]